MPQTMQRMPHINLTFIFMREIMPETITATYKNGCLYPLTPLNLPDNKAVRIIILSQELPDKKDEIVQIMSKAGLIRSSRQPPHTVPPDPVSENERIKIAKKLGQVKGKPLSEIIISERDQ
jgi:predicted DNA-binding antitoxin AbrB/MazE fold protein